MLGKLAGISKSSLARIWLLPLAITTSSLLLSSHFSATTTNRTDAIKSRSLTGCRDMQSQSIIPASKKMVSEANIANSTNIDLAEGFFTNGGGVTPDGIFRIGSMFGGLSTGGNFLLESGGYLNVCPSVSGISPTSGVVGSTVTITGNNLDTVTTVLFTNNIQATLVSKSSSTLTVLVPNDALTGAITLNSPFCDRLLTTNFSVNPNIICPSITGISPKAGIIGSTLTISGTGLNNVTITFSGNVTVTPVRILTTAIEVEVPLRALTGPLTIMRPGSICPDFKTEPFTVLTQYQISGLVTYALGDKSISNVEVTATPESGSETPAISTTDNNGKYSLRVRSDNRYEITGMKKGSVNGISAYDAYLVAKELLSGDKLRAADIDQNEKADQSDAEKILEYVVGIPQSRVGTWSIITQGDNRRSYSISVNGDKPNQNFKGILLGEISNNWSPLEPGPTISRVDLPNATDRKSWTIVGTGFQSNLIVKAIMPDGGEMTISGGSVNVVSSNTMHLQWPYPTSGLWRLQLINADGMSSSSYPIIVKP